MCTHEINIDLSVRHVVSIIHSPIPGPKRQLTKQLQRSQHTHCWSSRLRVAWTLKEPTHRRPVQAQTAVRPVFKWSAQIDRVHFAMVGRLLVPYGRCATTNVNWRSRRRSTQVVRIECRFSCERTYQRCVGWFGSPPRRSDIYRM